LQRVSKTRRFVVVVVTAAVVVVADVKVVVVAHRTVGIAGTGAGAIGATGDVAASGHDDRHADLLTVNHVWRTRDVLLSHRSGRGSASLRGKGHHCALSRFCVGRAGHLESLSLHGDRKWHAGMDVRWNMYVVLLRR